MKNCPDCEKMPPCCKHCGTCGKIVRPDIPKTEHCSLKTHLGYLMVGNHRYCPDCGEYLAKEKEKRPLLEYFKALMSKT